MKTKNLAFVTVFTLLGFAKPVFAQQAAFIEVNGSANGIHEYVIDVGQTLCLNLRGVCNSSATDTTILSWDQGIASATFTSVNNPNISHKADEATFCWTPSPAYHGCSVNLIKIMVALSQAKNVVLDSEMIKITVLKHSDFTVKHTQAGAGTFDLNPQFLSFCLPSDTLTASYLWSVSHHTNGIWVSSDCSTYTTKNVRHMFSKNGRYVYRLQMQQTLMGYPGHSEFYFDTLVVTGIPATGTSPVGNMNNMVYPNPAKDFIIIKAESGVSSVKLFDLIGNSIPVHLTEKGGQYQVSFHDLSAGVYLLKWKDENGHNYIRKIQVE